VQFGLGAVLPHSNTPSLREAGFEHEDDDEDEYEAVVRPKRDWGLMCAGAIVQIQTIKIENDL